MPDTEELTPARRALVCLSAALGSRDEPAIAAELRRAAEVADPVGVEEVILQSHLFVGFPTALEAMIQWRELGSHPAPAGPAPESPSLWLTRGEEVCARVYGTSYPKLRSNVAALHPDLDRWMVEGGYGRVIGRPGLDLATRELCIAALLAVLGAPRQLHSHLRGALNSGASPADVDAAVEIACARLAHDSATRVRELWAVVRAR